MSEILIQGQVVRLENLPKYDVSCDCDRSDWTSDVTGIPVVVAISKSEAREILYQRALTTEIGGIVESPESSVPEPDTFTLVSVVALWFLFYWITRKILK